MKSLLVEIGVEELPARVVDDAMRQLVDGLATALEQARLGSVRRRGFATPRRLAALLDGVAERQQEREVRVRGPARRVAFDEQGQPTRAALGFARSQGVTPESLVVERTPEGEYVFAVKREPARPAEEVLAEVIPQVVRRVAFTRSMRWGPPELRFARPIRWLVVLWGDQVLPVSLDGLQAGRESRGHRLAHPGPVAIPRADAYEVTMESVAVIADPERRRRMVAEEIEAAAARNAGHPLATPALLDEIANLVEYPVALVGRFDPGYLELPREVLMTTMAAHQRYVAVAGDDGRLLPAFVVVANGPHIHEALVREGNERVLEARLADARFFWREDRKQPLGSRVEQLRGVVFHERLGSMHDKVQRLVELVRYLSGRFELAPADAAAAERAAALSKADLVTHMVYEFPELQGIMGREYARASGEPEAVAVALAEQYQPRGAGDELPATPAGAVLSLADRLDTLVGFFGIGLGPTGSEDPFALRRHALALVRIVLARSWHGSLREAIGRAAGLYGDRLDRPVTELAAELEEFIRQRLRGLLADQGLAADVVEAALGAGDDDLAAVAHRARELARVVEAPYFDDALVAFQRAYNITRGRLDDGEVEASLLQEPSERALVEAMAQGLPEADERLTAGDVAGAVRRLAELRPAVDRFFDDVLVMAEDERVRANRLRILSRLVRAFARIANFAALTARAAARA
ncbi:glycine--tRNA ligase subunit beta [Geochorda subterranea]|uniref:Glycine--tRNA ligase beta subunit n=1 Tax=Geochorda subterranea TaxID=3109564 RepID=A0ABZ1BUK4_9FIRM|nr:glycine--tRNA ligase subunit beta [Limnochorda sp. LNt]WRP15802.1 glycine--tRNA ligase subunit beta [Limnochorda sp. LNt]